MYYEYYDNILGQLYQTELKDWRWSLNLNDKFYISDVKTSGFKIKKEEALEQMRSEILSYIYKLKLLSDYKTNPTIHEQINRHIRHIIVDLEYNVVS